jgi:predicted signal transduction protein with EAL and GGDEF domain
VGVGIALIPADAMSASEALRKADIALYRAKSERRSALRFFELEMDARVKNRASMEKALREALDKGEVKPVFQPTVNSMVLETEGASVVTAGSGAEALSSWPPATMT